MNAGRIYAEATGRATEQPEKAGPSPAEEALLLQQKLDWIAHPATKHFFKELGERIASLESTARNLAAAGTHPHNVTTSLVIAKELRELVDKYGNASNNSNS